MGYSSISDMAGEKKIGILGGTFNPIHTGHLLIADGVKEVLGLDLVLFIPCAIPPLKRSTQLLAARHRLQMVCLAVQDNPAFKVSSLELDRGGVSYSIDTLKHLREALPARFFFIIGSDSLAQLSLWRDIDQLFRLCTLVIVSRPGYSIDQKKDKILIKHKRRIKTIAVPTIPVSSTDIRRLLKQKRSVKHLVPDKVIDYIKKYRLYQFPATRGRK